MIKTTPSIVPKRSRIFPSEVLFDKNAIGKIIKEIANIQ